MVNWRERLRTAVRASRRKHSAIAADAGITPVTLSRILNAAEVKPAFETVVRIAHAVGESVGWLLEEPGHPLSAEQQSRLTEAVEFLHATFAAVPPGTQPNAVAVGKRLEIPRQERMLGARLVFRAIGPSMADAGIAEGDLVYVRPTRDLRSAEGSLVVCRVGSSEYLKQLELRGGDDFVLIGVVVGHRRAHAEKKG